MWWWVLLHLLAQAQDLDFASRVARIRSRQGEIDSALRGLGVKAGPVPNDRAEIQKERGVLLVQHGSLRATRVPAGQLWFGKLRNRLVVGADGSPALIDLDDRQGFASKLRATGVARQSGTHGRVSIEIQRLLLRTGKAVALNATALDAVGGYGLEAEVVSQKLFALGGAMASSFVTGAALSQQTQSVNAMGFSQTQPTGRNAILQGLAQTAADQSKRFIDEYTQEKPVLVVEAGTELVVLVQEEVRE